MKKLQDFIYEYGTDGLEAMVQAIVAQIPQEKLALFQAGKITCKMVAELTEGLREYAMDNGMKKQVTDYR